MKEGRSRKRKKRKKGAACMQLRLKERKRKEKRKTKQKRKKTRAPCWPQKVSAMIIVGDSGLGILEFNVPPTPKLIIMETGTEIPGGGGGGGCT